MSGAWMNVFHDQIQEHENKSIVRAVVDVAQDCGLSYNDAVDYVVKKFNVTPEYVNRVING